MQFNLPYALAQRFDATSSIQGLGDLGIGVARRLYEDHEGALKLCFVARLPTGDAVLGFGSGLPALGLELAFRREVIRDRLAATMNLGYLYQLRGTRDDPGTHLPVTLWLGDRWQGAVGLDYRVDARLAAVLEVLGQVDRAQESDRQAIPQTGSAWVLVAPGLSYRLSSALDLQASAVFPIWRGGYQDSFNYTAVAGARMRL